jgi:hypothetical protein
MKKINKKKIVSSDVLGNKQKLWGVITTIGLGVIGVFWGYYHYVQNEFSVLVKLVDDTTYNDETLYLDCTNKKLDDTKTAMHLDELRENFFKLLDEHKSMGTLVSLKTYCIIHEFTSYNNHLHFSDARVCSLPLMVKSPEKIGVWRDIIEKQINLDRESYRLSLKSSFALLYGNSYKTYSFKECEKFKSS